MVEVVEVEVMMVVVVEVVVVDLVVLTKNYNPEEDERDLHAGHPSTRLETGACR
ncbi:hypothetical protein STEG23_005242, partial [Scotinomys teguina]